MWLTFDMCAYVCLQFKSLLVQEFFYFCDQDSTYGHAYKGKGGKTHSITSQYYITSLCIQYSASWLLVSAIAYTANKATIDTIKLQQICKQLIQHVSGVPKFCRKVTT